MSKTSYPLKIPVSVKGAARLLAREDGVSLNQSICVAAAANIGAVETAATFQKQRAKDARPEDMLPFLHSAANEAAAEGDEIPPGAQASR